MSTDCESENSFVFRADDLVMMAKPETDSLLLSDYVLEKAQHNTFAYPKILCFLANFYGLKENLERYLCTAI